jgi:uncharacterized delta-60 repeat protein
MNKQILRAHAWALAGIVLLMQMTFGQAQPAPPPPEGAFDPTFGDGGRMIVDVSTLSSNDTFAKLIVRPGNKLLMAGSCVFSNPESGTGYTYCLTQLNDDGTYDEGFGPGGVGYVQFDRFAGFPNNIAPLDMIVLSDGRIALLGAAPTPQDGSKVGFLLAVLQADGSALDPNVGAGKGYIEAQFGGVPSAAGSMVQQPDGKIVVAGEATGVNGNADFAVGRFLADLSGFDPSFGSGGSQVVAFDLGGPTGDNTDECLAVRLQSSGKIVLAGISVASPAKQALTAVEISLVRLNSNGSRDTSFGSSGDGRMHYKPSGQDAAVAYDARIDAGDRIVIGGGAANSGATTNVWLIDRLAPDGGRDASFNNGSPQMFYQSPGNAGQVVQLALTNDGIFGIGPTPRAPGSTDAYYFAVVRLNANGSFDTRFGGGGKTYGSFTATRDVNTTNPGIAVGNGGVMVAGTQAQSIPTENANDYNFAIGRLEYDQIFSYGFE